VSLAFLKGDRRTRREGEEDAAVFLLIPFLKANKSALSTIHNKQLFKIRTHLMRQRHAGTAAELYVCPVCKSGFKEKVLLAIHIGTRH
jgi:hypothetical protein